MRFTVLYVHSAENELAQAWVRAADRKAVQRAADEIDQKLKSSPEARGNDQAGVYELTVFPLRVVYEVFPDDRKVIVFTVTCLA